MKNIYIFSRVKNSYFNLITIAKAYQYSFLVIGIVSFQGCSRQPVFEPRHQPADSPKPAILVPEEPHFPVQEVPVLAQKDCQCQRHEKSQEHATNQMGKGSDGNIKKELVGEKQGININIEARPAPSQLESPSSPRANVPSASTSIPSATNLVESRDLGSADSESHPEPSCPSNYVLVPNSQSRSSSDSGDKNNADEKTKTGEQKYFCLSTFEMKIKNEDNGNTYYIKRDIPESRPEGTPWVNINRDQAIAECQSLGVGYDLISNDEWQATAKNLESNPKNWTSGEVGKQMMYRGHSDYPEEGSLAVSDITDPYNGTNNTENEIWGEGKEQRRTLYLSDGQVLWDFAGNVREWVKDSIKVKFKVFDWDDSLFVSQLSDKSFKGSNLGRAKELFGAGRTYEGDDSGKYFGLGILEIWFQAGGIIRGGAFNDGVRAGVFSTFLYSFDSDYHEWVGFRCVKHVDTETMPKVMTKAKSETN